jgi:hypothetical protein
MRGAGSPGPAHRPRRSPDRGASRTAPAAPPDDAELAKPWNPHAAHKFYMMTG